MESRRNGGGVAQLEIVSHGKRFKMASARLARFDHYWVDGA
jgi:hypothetical protein